MTLENIPNRMNEKFASDHTMVAVYFSIVNSKKSVKQISKDTGIPRTTVYRKIKSLMNIGTISATGRIRKNGVKDFFYHAKVSQLPN